MKKIPKTPPIYGTFTYEKERIGDRIPMNTFTDKYTVITANVFVELKPKVELNLRIQRTFVPDPSNPGQLKAQTSWELGSQMSFF